MRTGALKTAGNYAATGTIELSGTSAAATLALIDAKVDPGPDLVIYLTPKAGAVTISGAIRIASFKSTAGTQTFAVPVGTDIAAFNGVLIWCDKFSVPFAIAELK
jgi:Electron transfer DM13